MFPVLIDLGIWDLPFLGPTPIFLPSYGVLFASSVVLAWIWFSRRARGLGVDGERLFNLVFYAVLASILGAKLLLILLDWRYYLEQPARILGTLRSAGVLVGGIVAGALVFAAYCRRHGLPTWQLGDAVAAPLALAQGIGRLGCFAAGCCWGNAVHTGHPLAVTFTDPVASAQTGVPLYTPLVATQLLQFGADLLLALVLMLLWRRRPQPDGTVFWTYVLLYSITRGTIEFWRGDVARGLWLGGSISTSQLFALAGALVATFVLARGHMRARRTARA